MSETAISFPNLGITVDPNPMPFERFGINIHWYGIVIALGVICAYSYTVRRSKHFGCTEDDTLDMFLWAIPIGFVCARIYYCLFYWKLYADDPISVLYIWEGGIAIYGGVIGGAVTLMVLAKKKKIPASVLLDQAAMAVLIGQIFGRWGNFFNREAFGAYSNNLFSMRISEKYLSIPADASERFLKQVQLLENKAMEGGYEGFIQVHPTFLYESLWNLVGFVALHIYTKKRKFDGEIALLYIAWYGLGRAWIEGLRTDSLYFFSTGIRVSQMVAILSFVLATLSLVQNYRRRHRRPLYVLRKAAREAQAAAEVSEEI